VGGGDGGKPPTKQMKIRISSKVMRTTNSKTRVLILLRLSGSALRSMYHSTSQPRINPRHKVNRDTMRVSNIVESPFWASMEDYAKESVQPSLRPRTARDGQVFYDNGKSHRPGGGARPPGFIAGHGRYCMLPWLQGLTRNPSPIALSVGSRSPYQAAIIIDLDRRVERGGAGDGRLVIFEDAAVRWGGDDRRSQSGCQSDGRSSRRLERY
jgi:hypothetical protein